MEKFLKFVIQILIWKKKTKELWGTSQDYYSDEEKYCVQICLKLLENSSSKLTFAPVSSTRFIVNDDKQMFVVINNHTINITNHVYSYTVYVQESSSYTKVVKRFDTLLEEERQNIQEEIRRNIKHSLQCILNTLN